ncbi:Ff.00g054320.m01.CDS01 [Fusarium sp. VM40]|nr:Ff.00g054320.m01.CDS01 [Fusarium sp. VM40]
MSTDLFTFLNYMSGWTGESDEHVQTLIDEHNLFVSLGDFNSDAAVDTEFNTLVGIATEVRDKTIAADALQISADAAAVGAIWSFGIGMAAFAVLETTAMILKGVISSKSKDLNEKLKTVDTDIAKLIDPKVNQYISAYKANNTIVAAKQAKGMDGQTCRAILLQFMAQIEVAGGKLDVATFKQYANSARRLFDSEEIKAVYDALDDLNMSVKSDDDLQKFVDSIKGFTFNHSTELTMVRLGSIFIVNNRMKVATKRLAEHNAIAEFVGAEAKTSVFKMMDCWGKFFAVIAVVTSVADVVLQILDIVNVVEQTKKMVDELNGTMKTNYKAFFNGIKEAANHYNEAIKKKKTG